MSKLRDLLKKHSPNGVKYEILKNVVEIKRGVRVVKNQLSEIEGYPVYQNSMTPLGFFDKCNCPSNTTFVIAAGAAGEIGFSDCEFWAADDCYFFQESSLVQSKYLYYALLQNQLKIKSQVRKASIPRLSRTVLENLSIPVPPLEVQHEIVHILDNFTELTAELTAELHARKKQYEFYRNQIFSFKAD